MRPVLVRATALAVMIVCGLPASAEETEPCKRFAWPLTTEREQLQSAMPTANGSAWDGSGAVALVLLPIGDAGLPMQPERRPGSTEARAAFVRVAEPRTGRVQVTVTSEVWIDVIQDGRYARAVGNTAVRGCPGLRKSVRYDLGPGPVVIQVSGSEIKAVSLTLTSVP